MNHAEAWADDPVPPASPATSLSVQCDDTPLLPGAACVLTFGASDLPDIQYAGLELRYDTARLTFLQERAGPVFGGDAVTIARHLPDGRLGVSVSSTDGERPADGDIIYMDFVVRDGAPDGAAVFAVEYLEVTDRDGSPLPAPLPDAAGITIPPYLSDAGITGPGPVTIARGSELLFSFRLAASGVTAADLDNPERFSAGMALIDAGLWDGLPPFPDQAAFDRIVPLTYTGTSGGQFRFQAPFPPEQAVGTWRVAAIFRLDDHPELVAGYGSDGGGLWDGQTFTAVEVTVTTPRVTVAEWTFDGEQWTADTGLFTNLQPDAPAEISLFGARFSGWTTGSSGRAPNSNNWQQENNGDDGDNGDNGDGSNGSNGGGDDSRNGDADDGEGSGDGSIPDGDGSGDGDNGSATGDNGDTSGGTNGDPNGSTGDGPATVHDKYWQARLSTGGYRELTLQFRMNGSGTGPRDFRIYYSVDNNTDDNPDGDPVGGATEGSGEDNGEENGEESRNWQPVPDGQFQAGTSWTLFTMNLPADAADAGQLLLRWVRIGNTSIAGNEIGPTGTNRLDEVRITGVPMDTEEMFVWPGNTRGEGAVTEADVLNLGLYWMSTGPERVPRSIAWAPQPVVRWTPGTAAHADTDGDGRVGYRDLLAIGRNFGETVDPGPQKIAAAAAPGTSAAGIPSDGRLDGHYDGHSGGHTGSHHESHPGNHTGNHHDRHPGNHTGSHQNSATAVTAEAGSGSYVASLLRMTLPVLSAQETVRVVLRSDRPVPLLGISTRFFLDQLPPDAWELVEFTPGNWADEWISGNRLIRFHHGRAPETLHKAAPGDESTLAIRSSTAASAGDTRPGNAWSAAWANAGTADPVPATELAVLIIRARTDWHTSPILHLQRTSVSAPAGLDGQPDTRSWELVRQDRPVDAGRDPAGEIPLATRLHANYPNPFNPSTTLSFDLHQPGEVRLSIYDALGRRIAVLTDTHMDAGRHELTWDASRLASGMYLVRLETPHTTQTRQIMLVK